LLAAACWRAGVDASDDIAMLTLLMPYYAWRCVFRWLMLFAFASR
jgi:hypothetical protein